MGMRLPGFTVGSLLGSGPCAEVWVAREVASGELVVLKRLRLRVGAAAVERLAAEGAAVSALGIPHVVRLRAVLDDGAVTVLVLDYAGRGSLAGLLAARGPLSPAEVVTVGAPLAQALSALHAAGMCHGDVAPARVFFAADGRPMLADVGVARALGETARPAGPQHPVDPARFDGASPSPASDVYALAACCVAALTGSLDRVSPQPPDVPSGLGAALAAALDPDPTRRPTADELAAALFAACRPAPIRFPPRAGSAAVPTAGTGAAGSRAVPRAPRPVPAARPSGRSGRHASRRPPEASEPAVSSRVSGAGFLAVLAGGVVLTCAGAAGIWWAGAAQEGAATVLATTPASAPPSAPGTAWREVLARLDERRARAFADADPGALTAVYAAGSEPLAADLARLHGLASRGLRARGLRPLPRSVRPLEVGRSGAVLQVTDRLPPYLLVDRSGGVVARPPGRDATTWRITLLPAGDQSRSGWRISAIERVGGRSG
jgi:eukaryotic-like serine/threonine-protein kinase